MTRFTWAWLDSFLFDRCDPMRCVYLRIHFAILMLINTAIWMLDSTTWFTDAGVLQAETIRAMGMNATPSLLYWMPSTPAVVQVCLVFLLVHSVLLLCGLWSRIQIASIFVWLVSFHHRNPLILDGEDTVMRLFAFFMIFMPLDYRWSVTAWLQRRAEMNVPRRVQNSESVGSPSAWALRLVQIQLTAIYLSTAWCKLQGETWQNGTALYYVAQMHDVFGRFYLPGWIWQSGWLMKLATWSVLVGEMVLPIALWLRPTRKLAVALGLVLHLAIEYSMNLFLFEWVMIVGLLTFWPSRWMSSNPSVDFAPDGSSTLHSTNEVVASSVG